MYATGDGDQLLTVPEAAGRLRVSEATVFRMVQRGELEAVRLGGERHRPIRISAAGLAAQLRGWTAR